jgi:hypothetical protein
MRTSVAMAWRELARVERPDRRHIWVRAALGGATDGVAQQVPRLSPTALDGPPWMGSRLGWRNQDHRMGRGRTKGR